MCSSSFLQNASAQYLGEVFFDISLFVHCGCLVALTYHGLCSAFISALWVAFPLLTKLCVHKDLKQHGRTLLITIQVEKNPLRDLSSSFQALFPMASHTNVFKVCRPL